MIKKSFITLFIIGILIVCTSNVNYINPKDNPDRFIVWDGKYQLKWDDFQGEPNYNQKYAAVTWTMIERKQVGLLEDKILVHVSTLFIINKSWIKKGEQNNNLLLHEQLHWDIAELYARKSRKTYLEHISYDLNSTFKFMNEDYDKMLKEKEVFQKKYDIETNYSKNKVKQKEWAKKVKALLKEYEAYADTYIEIKRVKK